MDNFVIIGGDYRMQFAYNTLINKGFNVICYGNNFGENAKSLDDAISFGENILFGLPLSRDRGESVFAPFCNKKILCDDLIEFITPNHRIFAGMPGDFATKCAKKGAAVVDYNMFEHFKLLNANMTSEALLSVIINEIPTSICGSKFLVIGYGRIGKRISYMLKSLGGNVWASARKHTDFAKMDIMGINSLNTSDISLENHFDAVINTVPQKVTKDIFYQKLNKDCIVIDASQSPGFVDKDLCEKYNIKLVPAFGLPGKFSPRSAGEIIANSVIDYITQ